MENERAITEISEWMRDAAEKACTELFESYGVPVTVPPNEPPVGGDILYCGVIGFVGVGIRGTCLLAVSKSPLERSRPIEGSLRDWTGELANQLVGRLKVKLLTRQIRVGISTPVVLRGEHLAPLPRKGLTPVVLQADPGTILLWVELDAKDDFVLPPEIDAPDVPPEGEFELF